MEGKESRSGAMQLKYNTGSVALLTNVRKTIARATIMLNERRTASMLEPSHSHTIFKSLVSLCPCFESLYSCSFNLLLTDLHEMPQQIPTRTREGTDQMWVMNHRYIILKSIPFGISVSHHTG